MGRFLKIGCGCLAILVLLCLASLWFAQRALQTALPDAEAIAQGDPVNIEGDCTQAEVRDYLADTGPRLERLYAELGAFGERPDGQRELSAIDVAALRETREELAGRSVAPCLVALRDEELALADTVIEVIAGLQVGTPSRLGAAAALFRLLPSVRTSVGRMTDAHRRLELRYGLTDALGTPLPAIEANP